MIMLDVLNFDSFAIAWKNKLRSLKAENQVEIYQTLSILAKETDPSVFQMQMKNFITAMATKRISLCQILCANLPEPSRYIYTIISIKYIMDIAAVFLIKKNGPSVIGILIMETQTQICILRGK